MTYHPDDICPERIATEARKIRAELDSIKEGDPRERYLRGQLRILKWQLIYWPPTEPGDRETRREALKETFGLSDEEIREPVSDKRVLQIFHAFEEAFENYKRALDEFEQEPRKGGKPDFAKEDAINEAFAPINDAFKLLTRTYPAGLVGCFVILNIIWQFMEIDLDHQRFLPVMEGAVFSLYQHAMTELPFGTHEAKQGLPIYLALTDDFVGRPVL